MLVGISNRTCHKVLLEDLEMQRFALNFVPRLLIVDQKQQSLDVCLDFKENAANDRMSLRVSKPGFRPTTWKPKLNPVNGKVQGHLNRRRQGK